MSMQSQRVITKCSVNCNPNTITLCICKGFLSSKRVHIDLRIPICPLLLLLSPQFSTRRTELKFEINRRTLAQTQSLDEHTAFVGRWWWCRWLGTFVNANGKTKPKFNYLCCLPPQNELLSQFIIQIVWFCIFGLGNVVFHARMRAYRLIFRHFFPLQSFGGA